MEAFDVRGVWIPATLPAVMECFKMPDSEYFRAFISLLSTILICI